MRGEEYGSVNLFAHELAHAALSLPDLYTDTFGGDPSRIFTLMADLPATHSPHFSPWARIHLGWLQPTVITVDGDYSIPAIENDATAYILHDPAHGEEEYFIIENRWPAASAYEQGLEDQGLAVWHITEFYDGEPFDFNRGRKMVAMKWAGGATALDTPPYSGLWDCDEIASCYDLTDGSAPRDSRWEDGTTSGIAIRGISRARAVMQATFDVPPTSPVELSSFAAEAAGTRVTVRWVTIREVATAGFHLLRARTPVLARARRVNAALIPAGRGRYTHTDRALAPGQYWYWLEEADRRCALHRYGPVTVRLGTLAVEGLLLSCHPNPVMTTADFTLSVDAPGRALLQIFDVHGRQVRALLDEKARPGLTYHAPWGATDTHGRRLPAGTSTSGACATGSERSRGNFSFANPGQQAPYGGGQLRLVG